MVANEITSIATGGCSLIVPSPMTAGKSELPSYTCALNRHLALAAAAAFFLRYPANGSAESGIATANGERQLSISG
jgi:hypothetical protein